MSKRALIVDDDLEFRNLATAYLTDLGYVADAAETVAAAEATIHATGATYHLIVCDVNMPEARGQELLRALKQTTGELPLFVFVTAQADQATVSDLIALEADYIICKPLSREALAAGIEKGERRRQDREFQKIMRGQG